MWTVWLDEPLSVDYRRLLGGHTEEFEWSSGRGSSYELPAGHNSLVRHAEGSATAAAAAEVRRRLPPALPREHSSVVVVMSGRAAALVSGLSAGPDPQA